jgi:hypothetical protein
LLLHVLHAYVAFYMFLLTCTLFFFFFNDTATTEMRRVLRPGD